jgi:hypothetical protein
MRQQTYLALLCLLAACSSGPVTVERGAMEQRRLLAPYLTGAEVGCGTLLIEMTGNFYPNVAQPALNPKVHSMRKEQGPGYTETVWTNKVGDPIYAFAVTISEADPLADPSQQKPATKYTVVNELRVRVFGDGHTLALDATAGGKPLLLKEGPRLRDLVEYQVRNGEMKVQ